MEDFERSNLLDNDAEWATIVKDFKRAELEYLKVKTRHADIELRNYLTSGEESRTYSFYGPILGESVLRCIRVLDTWSRRFPGEPIEIIFTSGGGSTVDGFALYDFIRELRRRGHYITTKALSAAMSMAAVLLQAGDKRIMTRNGILLLHEVRGSFFDEFTLSSMEDDKKFFEKTQNRIVEEIAARSNMTPTMIKNRIRRKDSFIDAQEALKLGLVDEVF